MNKDFITEMLKLAAAGAVGGYATFIFEKRKQNFAKNLEAKREIYNEFTSLIIDLFKNTKRNKNEIVDEVFLDNFYEFYKKFILYASSKSINAFADWMAYLRSVESGSLNNKVWINKLSVLLGSMRKDVGLGNFWLGSNNAKIMRAIINDFDQVFMKARK